ncbi:MAG: MFS transporter [Silicimonas sp.]|nr:MFS transporter [Silicimonas sp.]
MKTVRFNPRKTATAFGMVFGTIIASIAFVMELTLLPLILGPIQQDLGLSLSQLSWVFNTYAFAVAAAVLVTGMIGDLVNKRWLFAFGVILFASGSALAAMSSDFQSLVLSRALQGAGGGLFSPLVPILLTHAFPVRSGRILMIWGGLAGIAATVLPIMGHSIQSAFGWRAIFYAFAGTSLIALILASISAANTYPQAARGIPRYRSLRAHPGIWLILVYIFLTYGSFTYYLFYLPTRLHSGASVALLLTSVWFSFSIFSFVLRDKLEGHNLKRTLMFAPLLLTAGFLTAIAFQDATGAQYLSAILVGAGLACSNSPSTHLLLKLTPTELRALTSSLDITFARCGGAIAVALFSDVGPVLAASAVITFFVLAIVCAGFAERYKANG